MKILSSILNCTTHSIVLYYHRNIMSKDEGGRFFGIVIKSIGQFLKDDVLCPHKLNYIYIYSHAQ